MESIWDANSSMINNERQFLGGSKQMTFLDARLDAHDEMMKKLISKLEDFEKHSGRETIISNDSSDT